MRMLEREFGKEGQRDGEGEIAIGSVDCKGKLITAGPKKRLAVRCAEVILALTAAVACIYAAVIIKPTSIPPPSGKLPLYVLYVLSVLSFLSTTYLFLIYPCCCGGRGKDKGTPFTGPGGLMVLPVQSLPGGKKKKEGKKKGAGNNDSVQVNLIVDPTLFVSMILWGTEFVLILLGPRCPSSGDCTVPP